MLLCCQLPKLSEVMDVGWFFGGGDPDTFHNLGLDMLFFLPTCSSMIFVASNFCRMFFQARIETKGG